MEKQSPLLLSAVDEEEKILYDTLASLRLAGIQSQFYPAGSPVVRASFQDAHMMLGAFLKKYKTLILSINSSSIIFNGRLLRPRKMLDVSTDLHNWLSNWNLESITFLEGITLEELMNFFNATLRDVASNDPGELFERLAHMDLIHIDVAASREEEEIIASFDSPTNPVSGMQCCENCPARAAALQAGLLPAELVDAHYYSASQVSSNNNFDLFNGEMLGKLLVANSGRPVDDRRRLYIDLTNWLAESSEKTDPETLDALDIFLLQMIKEEQDAATMRIHARIIRERLAHYGKTNNKEAGMKLLETVQQRLEHEPSTSVRHYLESAVAQALGDNEFRDIIIRLVEDPEQVERVRNLNPLFNADVVRPIVESLRIADSMEERSRIIQFMQLLKDDVQPLLISELTLPNPWFFYRNLLAVLAEIGNENALNAIDEKLNYPDPRVRIAALTAAVKIAKEKGAAYLLNGLNDGNISVRAHAASLARLCPTREVLDALLELLSSVSQGKQESEEMQYSASLALGSFSDEIALEALEQIVIPPLFGRKMSERVRSVALFALESRSDIPHVKQIIQQAAASRSTALRTAAQQILKNHPEKK